MAEHDPLPVPGYTKQSDERIAAVAANKQTEERILRMLDEMKTRPGVEQRWLAIGRTLMEESWMCINRAVFQPERVKLPEDQR